MKDKINFVFGLGGCALGLIGLGYALCSRKQLKDICNKLNTTIDNISKDIEVEVPKAIVDKAVSKTVDREVEWAVSRAINETVKSVKSDIHTEVEAAVKLAYSNVEKSVSEEIATQVSKINMRQLSDRVTAKAQEKIIEKFDGNLDDLLDQFNKKLDDTSKIYQSIADTMSKRVS